MAGSVQVDPGLPEVGGPARSSSSVLVLVMNSFPVCRRKVGSKVISVAVTPNGYADAVSGERFVMPEERRMTFSSVLDIIEGKVRWNTNTAAVFDQLALGGVLTSVCCCCLFQTQSRSAVFYVQKQCSNLLEELPELTDDVEPHISWMSTALGDLTILSALRPTASHLTLLLVLFKF